MLVDDLYQKHTRPISMNSQWYFLRYPFSQEQMPLNWVCLENILSMKWQKKDQKSPNSPKNGITSLQQSKNSAVGIRSFSKSSKSSNFLGAFEKNVSINRSLIHTSLDGALSPTLAGMGIGRGWGPGEAGGEEVGVTKKSELVRRWVMSEVLLVGVTTSSDWAGDWETFVGWARVREPVWKQSCESRDSECDSGLCPVSITCTSVARPFCLTGDCDVLVRCIGRDLVGCVSAKDGVGLAEDCLWASGEAAACGGKGGLCTGVTFRG